MDAMAPQMIGVRTPERRSNLSEWRSRYSRNEYPQKVALNIVGEALTNKAKQSVYDDSFGASNAPNMDSALENVYSKEKELRRGISVDTKKTYKNGSKVGTLEIGRLKSNVKEGEVEEIEFGYIYHGLTYDVFSGWYAAGLCGFEKREAMGAMTGYALDPPDIDDNTKVESFFNDYVGQVLDQSDLYNPLPTL